MNTAETLITLMDSGLNMLFDTVKAMPTEKLTWKPAPTSRTVVDLLNEFISTIPGSADMLTARTMNPDFVSGFKEGVERTVAEYESDIRAATKTLYAAMRAFPESDFTHKLSLPWGDMSFLDIMSYPYWNLMYHIGQINYIQTLYGDTDMH